MQWYLGQDGWLLGMNIAVLLAGSLLFFIACLALHARNRTVLIWAVGFALSALCRTSLLAPLPETLAAVLFLLYKLVLTAAMLGGVFLMIDRLDRAKPILTAYLAMVTMLAVTLPLAWHIGQIDLWSGAVALGFGTLLLAGAVRALAGGRASLLPGGILEASGEFHRGDLVEIVDETGTPVARGLSQYGFAEVRRLAGRHSRDIESLLGYSHGAEVVHRDDLATVADNGEGDA